MHLKASNSVGRRTTRARPITVHFQIPRRSISKLRALAIGKDPRLVDLGVLAVQISDDESIVLGIELEKAKRKDPLISKTIATTSSTAFTPRTMMNFDSLTRNVGSFATSSAEFYSSQFLKTTTRNETFTSKTKKPLQNAAVRKKAKETLNAARRGSSRGRGGRAGKGGQASGTVARASTWEMVYSHLGLPGDYRRKSSNPPYLEPTVASQASGIANVPAVHPARENTPFIGGDSTKKRESASSPPLKSPGNNAIYSEDDSSVSSSPCSHSPMNQEELINLFVDSNFSATSVLKQLAESRVKEDGKNTDDVKSSDKQTELDHVWSTWHSDTSAISPKTSRPDDKPKTETSANGGGLSHFTLSSTPTSSTSTTLTDTPCTGPIKRSRTLLEESTLVDSFIGSVSDMSEKSAKRQKQSFVELEIKKEMFDVSNKYLLLKQEQKKLSEASTVGITTSQAPSQLLETTSTTTIKLPSKPLSTQNAALRNFSQYGYYYSSEDLKALGSKALGSKSVTKTGSSMKATKSESVPQHQPSVCTNSSANIDFKPTSLITSQQSQVACDSKPAHQLHDSISSSSSTIAVNQVTNTSSLQHFSECSNKVQSDSSTGNDAGSLKTGVNNNCNVLGDCVSSGNDVPVASPLSQQNSSATDSKESTVNTPTTSSSLASSSSSEIKLPEQVSRNSSNFRSGGQCYSLSYVYPMGTVWYPYVAITPYAVLGINQKNGSEVSDNDETKASNGFNSYSTAQYIDLASSLRYWQQLSLLYKNKLLAPTTCISLTGSDKGSIAPVSSLPPNTASTTSISDVMHSLSSCSSSGSSNSKPARRASVIVTAKDMVTYSNEKGTDSRRILTSTPESTCSSESTGSDVTKSEVPVVIDNCDRLIEEHCHRMSEVFAKASEGITSSSTNTSSNDVPAIPSLSFIPDSSIAYVNIGNNSGTKKSGGKAKSKRRKSNKSF